MRYRSLQAVAVCVKCGCHDLHACEAGCYWLRVDYASKTGVCSECPSAIAEWESAKEILKLQRTDEKVARQTSA